MNSKDIKYKPLTFYQQKYYRKLQEPYCLIEPLNSLCGGWFLETFKQVINKLSINKSSPLPLHFPNVESMQLITKNKMLLKQVFSAFDTRMMSRIDASEVYCALLTISKGSYQIFLKTIVDVFGFEYPGRILKESIPKIIIVKDFKKPTEPNVRLQFEDIQLCIKAIFAQSEQIQRNDIYEAMLKKPDLNQFIKFVQKKCNVSAEKYRNETIQRVGFEAQVRKCLGDIVQKVVATLAEQQQMKQGGLKESRMLLTDT